MAFVQTPREVGRSNVDRGDVVEKGVLIAWPSDPATSWVYYECTVGTMLDSGIVVHNHLPQVDRTPDTLATCDYADPRLSSVLGPGVNLSCQDQYKDIVQRMGHSRYWFRLWGRALRIGYRVPIPGIKSIGGVPAIPYDKNPQWAFNRIAPGGNFSGTILWHAEWSLWYTISAPPSGKPDGTSIPANDCAAHIAGTEAPPTNGIQSPYSQPDGNSVRTQPPTRTTGTNTTSTLRRT